MPSLIKSGGHKNRVIEIGFPTQNKTKLISGGGGGKTIIEEEGKPGKKENLDELSLPASTSGE